MESVAPEGVEQSRSFPRGRRLLWTGLLILIAVGVLVGAARLLGPSSSRAQHSRSSSDETGMLVKTIVPKKDKSFVRSISGPAYVEAFFRADLFAHVAGPVKFVQKDIGDTVTEGELLVEIDVPDLVQEIALKESVIEQAIEDRNAAREDLQRLGEAVKQAGNAIEEKEAGQEKVVAQFDYKVAELGRYRILAERDAVYGSLVEEKEKDVKVAQAALKEARLAVKTAQSALLEVQAKLKVAHADVKVKEARIQVARSDKKRVEAQADWAKIRAPFSGVIIDRKVDPGSFVQNATTARTLPIMTIMRTDKVTVVMPVSERGAPYVAIGTAASIHIEVSPGRHIQNLRGRVTRFAPYLDPEKGRTLRAEVDLFNPPERGYKRSISKGVASFLSPLAARTPLGAAVLWAAGQRACNRPGLLRPGMYGTMRLTLEQFDNTLVLPSGAVFSHEGKTCILQVRRGHACRVPVRVQLEDGIRVRVSVITREADPETGEDEVTQDLTGTEEIVLNNQGEIGDGQPVRARRVEW